MLQLKSNQYEILSRRLQTFACQMGAKLEDLSVDLREELGNEGW